MHIARSSGHLEQNGSCRLTGNFENEKEQVEYQYEGETSLKDWAHGYGVATNPITGFTMKGNFWNSKPSGVMILEHPGVRTYIQCFKKGERFGRGTSYLNDGKTIVNYVWLGRREDEGVSRGRVFYPSHDKSNVSKH